MLFCSKSSRQEIKRSLLLISLGFVSSIINDVLQQTPPKKDLDIIRQNFRHAFTPLTTVLFQELYRFNALTSVIWKSMNELIQALNGQITFSYELDEINKSVYHGQIPSLWRSHIPQTKKSLGDWIEHLQRRNKQYEKWIHEGKIFLLSDKISDVRTF